MKKVTIFLTLILLACSVSAKSVRQIQVNFVDEFGDPVTNITSITVFNSGLGTSPTIYADRGASLTMTNPITTSSTNSTFDQSLGLVRWFQTEPDYKLTVTDGTKTLTVDSQNESNTRFPWYANYIGTAASLSVNDNQSIVVGTDSDMALAWVNASDFMSWIPAVDGSGFNLGTSGTGANVDFNWFVGTDLGIKGDEGAATLVIDGLTTSINASSNFATNINTGTSTGAVTIGSSTAGAITVDSTSTATMNSDGAFSITTSDASANITVDATAGSVIVDGGEAIADAVTIQAPAGGVDITSAATFDIDLTATGGKIIATASENAASSVSLITNGGGNETMTFSVVQGTGAASIDIDSTLGGITMSANAAGKDVNIDSVLGSINIEAEENTAEAVVITADGGTATTLKIHNDTGDVTQSVLVLSDVGGITVDAAAGSITLDAGAGEINLTATGATAGDMTLTVGDDLAISTTGDATITTGGTLSFEGSALTYFNKEIEIDTDNSESVLATDSGKVFTNAPNVGSSEFTLPTAAAGLTFTFVDVSSTAADDIWITAAAGDTIANGTAAKSFKNIDDALPVSCTITAVNAGSWVVESSTGSGWIADND